MAFFSQFPKVNYDFEGNGSFQRISDIFRSVRPQGNFIDNPSMYKKHQITNGDRPDVLSYKLYGTSIYYWTFFIVNDFLHDGIASWPMSQEDLQEYLVQNYTGTVIETRPTIEETGDGLITNFRDSLSGRFNIGETVNASTSSANGILVRKDSDLSQLVLKDVNGGSFKGNPETQLTEFVQGASSGDSVATYKVWDYAEAPAYWYLLSDPDKNPVTVDTVIPSGEPRNTCGYVSNRERVIARNDARSQIRVIDPPYIEQFAEEFEEIINA
jgi:hypothetical protein